MFANKLSPFSDKFNKQDIKFVFVSDLFVDDYIGGAELTTEAIVEGAPGHVLKIHSKDVTLHLIEELREFHWIICNVASLDMNIIPTIVANIVYDCICYDYSWCTWRSPEKHLLVGGETCKCELTLHGQLMCSLYLGSKNTWFMSEKQRNVYLKRFEQLKKSSLIVLSSVFSCKTLDRLKTLRKSPIAKDGWLVFKSNSWIKGTPEAEALCKEKNINYKLCGDLSYEEMLKTLVKSDGFVYVPPGADTCPRMVIEAKLLGCNLILNENVQHKDEYWFSTDNLDEIDSYLRLSQGRFWKQITDDASHRITISGYTTTKNCIDQNYPFEACIKSMLTFCDEIIVVDAGSTDGTMIKLNAFAMHDNRVKIHEMKLDWSHPSYATYDGKLKACALELCSSEYCWQMDADEIVHEDDAEKIITLARNFPKNVDVVALPVIEYWGGFDKVRCDVQAWKWRMIRRNKGITHGLPAYDRQELTDGSIVGKGLSDGCFVINNHDGSLASFATFQTAELEEKRLRAIFDKDALAEWERAFTMITSALPSVHHLSWVDIKRKFILYKNYWQDHWEMLSGKKTGQNFFFGKPWSEVSEQEMEDLAEKLRTQTGGHIFHSPVNWLNPTNWIKPPRTLPCFISGARS